MKQMWFEQVRSLDRMRMPRFARSQNGSCNLCRSLWRRTRSNQGGGTSLVCHVVFKGVSHQIVGLIGRHELESFLPQFGGQQTAQSLCFRAGVVLKRQRDLIRTRWQQSRIPPRADHGMVRGATCQQNNHCWQQPDQCTKPENSHCEHLDDAGIRDKCIPSVGHSGFSSTSAIIVLFQLQVELLRTRTV